MEHWKNKSLENIVAEIDGVVYEESWRPCEFYPDWFHISSFGRLKKLARKSIAKYRPDIPAKIMSQAVTKKGYLRVHLKKWGVEKKSQYVHRLVALAFIEKIEGKPDVNHKTGIKTDNHYTQLEWCTPQENNEHGVAMGLLKRGRNIKPYIRKGRNPQYKKVIHIETKEIFKSLHEVLKVEPNYRKGYFGKQLRGDRINTTPYRYVDADENFIRKPYKGQPKKPIAVFDVNWNYITQFDYMKDAAEYAGTTTSSVLYFLKGRYSQIKGHKFKRVSADGSFIEPIPFVPFIRPPKKIKIKQPPTPAKKVIKFSVDGEELQRFESIRLAANDANTEKKLFARSVRKSPRNFYKGFIYKFD